MITSNSILFTIICIFSIQAIVLSVLIVFKQPRSLSQKFLAMLTFFYALMALNIVLVNVLKDYGLLHVFRYVQLELLYGMGPALYFYTVSITKPSFKFSRKHAIHFLPLLLEFVFYRTSLYRNGADGLYLDPMPSVSYIYLSQQWIGVFSNIIYSVFSLRVLYKHQSLLKQYYSKLETYTLKWLQLPIIIYASFFIAYNVIGEIDRFVFDRNLREYYFLPAFVCLSIVCTWIAFKGYLIKHDLSSDIEIITKFANRKIVEKDEAFINKLHELMKVEKPYLNPDLNLTILSEMLEMKPKQVSLKINQNCSKNFYDLVNSYRIKEFQERAKSSSHEKFSVLGIALDCGFNSKSTFNHVFKKATQITPSQYLKSVKKES